jgi:Fe-S-cluster containining protein
MFSCNHNGQCCEDPLTQISLTLGDIKRICQHTKKTAIKLYKEGIIGIFPFGDIKESDIFELDVGLYIPCKYRIKKTQELNSKNKNQHKTCEIYPARPINCRLFPFWILADAPLEKVKEFASQHQCGKCCGIDENFENDRKKYKAYKEELVNIIISEAKISDSVYENIGIKKYIRTKESLTKIDDLNIIKQLISDLELQDFSDEFKKIDQEINKREFITSEQIPQWENFK